MKYGKYVLLAVAFALCDLIHKLIPAPLAYVSYIVPMLLAIQYGVACQKEIDED